MFSSRQKSEAILSNKIHILEMRAKELDSDLSNVFHMIHTLLPWRLSESFPFICFQFKERDIDVTSKRKQISIRFGFICRY